MSDKELLDFTALDARSALEMLVAFQDGNSP